MVVDRYKQIGRLIVFLLLASACCETPCLLAQPIAIASESSDSLQGNLTPVRDPTIIRQDDTYYIFSTDPGRPAPGKYLPIRCSKDRINWLLCSHVFSEIPSWLQQAVPKANNLWAPDISFFGGLYHLYYCASSPGSQLSAVGLATSPTLDSSSPAYQWVDRGVVIASHPGDDFNAIDPNIFVDSDQKVWLTYGSFWSGIKQREINPKTGQLLNARPAFSLAYKPDGRVIEGPSLLFHKGFYYLFYSFGRCCDSDLSRDDYQEAVGRSTSPHGPFIGQLGQPLLRGGGTIVLKGNSTWVAPGGASAWIDQSSSEAFLVYHALDADHNGRATLHLTPIVWNDGWPSVR